MTKDEDIEEIIYCLEKTILFLQGIRGNNEAIVVLQKLPSYKMMMEKATLTRSINTLSRYAEILKKIDIPESKVEEE